MKKEDIKAGMRVEYPETMWKPAGIGVVDKDNVTKGPAFGKTGMIGVGVGGGTLYFKAEDLKPAK